MTCGPAMHRSKRYNARQRSSCSAAHVTRLFRNHYLGAALALGKRHYAWPHATAPHVWQTYLGPKGQGSHLVTAMAKATWNDLLARFPEPHLLVAVLPASEKETIFNAQSAQRLMVRLIKKLSTKADFAVTVSRQSGQREILCAFADSSDARFFASIANASVSDCARYSFLLDGLAERKLIKIAGPPEPHRPRVTALDRWKSQDSL
jgi:hypothetical protein